MKKKNIALCLSLMMVAGSMVACGKKGGDSSTTPVPESSVPEVVTTSETTSEAVVTSESTSETVVTSEVHVHSFGEWAETKAPTCSEKGEAERTCTCGEKETKEIPAKGHSAASTWSSDATGHWHTCANNAEEKLDSASHTLFTNKDALAHWEECSVCGWQGEKVGHTFTHEEDDAHKVSNATPEVGAHYEERCECGQTNGVTYDGEPLAAKSYRIKAKPTLTQKGIASFSYEGYGEKSYFIPKLSDETFWTANVINGNCDSYEAEYTFKGALLGPAQAWLLSLDEQYATSGQRRVVLTSSVLVGCTILASTTFEEELSFVPANEACGQGTSGYYECDKPSCTAKYLDEEGKAKADETDLSALKATVVEAGMKNGEATVQLRITQGNIQVGEDLMFQPATGEAAFTATVTRIQVGHGGETETTYASKDSGNVYLTLSLWGASIDEVVIGDSVVHYFDDHAWNEEGFCPCGISMYYYQNVYMVSGTVTTAEDGGSNDNLVSGSTLHAVMRDGMHDIVFASVEDKSISSSDPDYAGRTTSVKNGNNFTAKVCIPDMTDLVKGGTFKVVNDAGETVTYVTITSVEYQNMIYHEPTSATFESRGYAGYYFDEISEKYYAATDLNTSVSFPTLAVEPAGSSKCSAWGKIESFEVITGRGTVITFTLQGGSLSESDKFEIYKSDLSVAVPNDKLFIQSLMANGTTATSAVVGDSVQILFRNSDYISSMSVGDYIACNYVA